MNRILNIVDYSNNSGLGHLNRTLVLNKIFENVSKFYFVSEKKILSKRRGTINYVKNINNFLKLNKLKYNYCIMDNYNITFKQEKKFKKICDKLIYIDDFQKRKSISDYIINPSPIAKKENYNKRTVDKKTKLLIGKKFNFLEFPYVNNHKIKYIKKKRVRIFVYLGTKNRLKLIKAIFKGVDKKKIKEIIIVNQKFKKKELNIPTRFLKNLKKKVFLSTMNRSDILILSSGIVINEASNLKKKIFLTKISSNQKKNYKFFIKKSFVSDVKEFKSFINMPVNYINKNLELMNNRPYDSYNKIINIKNLINPIKDNEGFEITLEKYSQKYCKSIYFLQSKQNREFLSNKKTFSYVKHKIYLNSFLKVSKNHLFVILKKNKFVGYIKFTKFQNYYDISIMLEKKFRNRSIATKVLKYFKQNKILSMDIKAKVAKKNISSIRAFKKAGFKINKSLKILN